MGRVFSPLDEELALLPGELRATLVQRPRSFDAYGPSGRTDEPIGPRTCETLYLAEGLARLGTRMPFAQAAEQLAFFWTTELDETTVRRHTETAGAAYVTEQTAEVAALERTGPPAPAGPPVQFLGADGAMVPLLHGEWAEVKTLALGVLSGCDSVTG